HRRLSVAGLALAVAFSSTGCGGKSQPEMPPPVNGEAPSVEVPATNSSVTSEPISKDLLDSEQRAALEQRIFFAFDQSDLSAAARELLTAKAEILRQVPSLSLRIEGHADERGSDEYNLALSSRRAAVAVRFLVSAGISAGRLGAAGYGEEQPLDPSDNESAWARNRRAEFRVTAGNLAQQ
ncbi:MAG: OmpA family protein, partial [Gemmatimonadales bacterium]